IAVAKLRQMTAGVLVDLYIVTSKAALFVGQCAVDQLLEVLDTERFEPKNLRTRDERAVHIKEWIVRGRSDKAETPSFDVGQKNVLLSFVEVVDLIDKQDRSLP